MADHQHQQLSSSPQPPQPDGGQLKAVNNQQHQQQAHLQQQLQQNDQIFIEQALMLLKALQPTSDATIQRQMLEKLNEWNNLPQFNYALMCIFADQNSSDEMVRCQAGLTLKNNVRSNYHNFTPELKDFIKKRSLELLRDRSAAVRSKTTTLITTIATCGELVTWTELLPTLTQLIVSPDGQIAVSAFSALEKICEDLAGLMCNDELSFTLNAMIPGFMKLFHHPNPKIRNHALACVNHFPIHTGGIMNHIDEYVKALFQLATDSDNDVRKNVCCSLVRLYDHRPEVLDPYLDDIIQYMKGSSRDEDPMIALEACEFWLCILENDHGRDMLIKHLPELIPFCMEKMRHSDEDIELMQNEIDEDCMIPDKEDDIKPRFHKPKNSLGNGRSDAFDEDGDDDDDDVDDVDRDGFVTWNIRKCTAAALDRMASYYNDDILPIIFPELQKAVVSPDWVIKEAAILTLGAIAEGCLTGMSPNLPHLIPYLVESLQDKHPMVRAITCWTLSRYTSWIMEKPDERFFGQVLKGLLFCILDNNKRVQEAACSAFATLTEGSNMELVRYLDDVLAILVQAFDKYQRKNLLNLYDAVGTLAANVKHHLNQPKYIEALMPPIIKKWNSLDDSDQDLFPLLECLSSIAVALGEDFKPYCEGVFRRCLSLVDQNLQQEIAFNLDPENRDMPNKDFMIAALDLLSGLAEGSKESITDLVASSNIVDLTLRCMFDTLPEVRQSSFALLGDLTKACFHLIKPHLPKIMQALGQNMHYEHISVCNNATWAIGELSIKLGHELRPYVHLFLDPLLQNINQLNIPRTLTDNTAISLGRLSLACPDEVAPHLKTFIKPWCASVQAIRDNEAKDTAFRGICELIKKNSTGVVDDFLHICDAIASCDEPKPDLKQLFHDLLHCFKNHVGEQSWQQFRLQFKPEIRDKLAARYGV